MRFVLTNDIITCRRPSSDLAFCFGLYPVLEYVKFIDVLLEKNRSVTLQRVSMMKKFKLQAFNFT